MAKLAPKNRASFVQKSYLRRSSLAEDLYRFISLLARKNKRMHHYGYRCMWLDLIKAPLMPGQSNPQLGLSDPPSFPVPEY